IAHYCRLEQIGEGTYGQVYRAKCLTPLCIDANISNGGSGGLQIAPTGTMVALKKIRLQHSGHMGIPPTVLREIKILKKLQHKAMVKMYEVVRSLFLSLEYISHDLTGLLDMAFKFTEVQVKSVVQQLLEVLEFMHERKYVHRDLKSSNILITDRFEVKLADFGLARCLEGEFTNKVITLWYRPPELLLGETRYGTAVDIWSAGCILAEVILGRPMFTGKTDMDQLKLIFDLIGTPTDKNWEGFRQLKLIRTGEVTIDKARRPKLREKYSSKIQPVSALNLLEKLLELDPKKRISARGALTHRYF
ncbi:predicted protein, partial [Thalassiosira pseudonana CCMP1335]